MDQQTQQVRAAFTLARQRYADMGVDVDQALETLASIPISLHCWQGDDVAGFERAGASLEGGGIQCTGNYPGRARNLEELRGDLDTALSHIPGRHRLNLHAIYGDFQNEKVDRDEIEPRHFDSWIAWAKERNMGLDFNPSFFSHPKADDGFTLSHSDREIAAFWIRHGQACRRIAAHMGRELGSPSVMNIWVPDGSKDNPYDRQSARLRLKSALDEMCAESFDSSELLDCVECKLFGIGAESCTVGSHEFYMGYAMSRKTLLCLDSGHFHPTEVISDKISSILAFLPEILLHVSRPVRWDSDHVVILNDEIQAVGQEIIRGGHLQRVHIGLDFFDATINRIAAWVIGTRSMIKSLLLALLEPDETLRRAELAGDYTTRLALTEELKTMPFGAIWDYYCLSQEAGVGPRWLDDVKKYENDILRLRA